MIYVVVRVGFWFFLGWDIDFIRLLRLFICYIGSFVFKVISEILEVEFVFWEVGGGC